MDTKHGKCEANKKEKKIKKINNEKINNEKNNEKYKMIQKNKNKEKKTTRSLLSM